MADNQLRSCRLPYFCASKPRQLRGAGVGCNAACLAGAFWWLLLASGFGLLATEVAVRVGVGVGLRRSWARPP